jgi:hypothetical protein
MGISLPRPVSNTDSCLILQLRFLTPSLDQQRSFADWAASVATHSCESGFSGFGHGHKIGFKYQFASDRLCILPLNG